MPEQDDPFTTGVRHQLLLREVNERIWAVVDDGFRPEFLCECSDPACIEQVELSVAEYEEVRSSPLRFLIAPSHHVPQVERVVEENDHFVVVETVGKAATIALAADRSAEAS